MALIDSIETTIPGANNISGRELIQGEQVYYRCRVRNRSTRDPVDLSGLTIDIAVRHLHAKVSPSGGGGFRITSYQEDAVPVGSLPFETEDEAAGIGGWLVPESLQAPITDPYAKTTSVPVKLLIASFQRNAAPVIRRRFRHLLIYRRAE